MRELLFLGRLVTDLEIGTLSDELVRSRSEGLFDKDVKEVPLLAILT